MNAEPYRNPAATTLLLRYQDFVDGRLAAGEMGTGIKLENMVPKVIQFTVRAFSLIPFWLSQCCGSGIRCFFTFLSPMDPGWDKNLDPG